MPSIIRAIGTRDKFPILGDGSSEIFYRGNGPMPRIFSWVISRVISRVMEGLSHSHTCSCEDPLSFWTVSETAVAFPNKAAGATSNPP